MKLLYCYSEFYKKSGEETNLRGLKRIELNFSTDWSFSYDGVANTLSVQDRETPLPTHFWKNDGKNNENEGASIYNINVLAGQNGSGKSTVINYLIDLLSYIYRGFQEGRESKEDTTQRQREVIRDYLYSLTAGVKLAQAAGIFSSVYHENFFRDFLNNLFGWRLESANYGSFKTTGVDLIDHELKIAVDIGVDCSRQRINHCLERFVVPDNDCWTLYFLAMKNHSPKYKKNFVIPDNIVFDPDRNILNVDALINRAYYADSIVLDRLVRTVEFYKSGGKLDDKEYLRTDSFNVSNHRTILVFEEQLGDKSDYYIMDCFSDDYCKGAVTLDHSLSVFEPSIVTVNSTERVSTNTEHFLSLFRRIKVVNLTNTLNLFDMRRGAEVTIDSLKKSFIYDCSLSRAMLNGPSSFYNDEFSIQTAFIFDEKNKKLIDEVNEIRFPNEISIWPRRLLWGDADYSPLYAGIRNLEEEMARIGKRSMDFTDELCSLCIVSYLNAISQQFGVAPLVALSGWEMPHIEAFTCEDKYRLWNEVLSSVKKSAFSGLHMFNSSVLHGNRFMCYTSSGAIAILDLNERRCIKVLTGHLNSVNCATVLPNGQIVSGSGDSTIRIWDPDSGECRMTLRGHTDSVRYVAVLPDKRIVSASDDHTLLIWDAHNGLCLRKLIGHSDHITCAAILPNGKIVSGSDDKSLRIWDPATGECLKTLIGHSEEVFYVVALPDGRFVSGSYDNTLRVWDPNTGECLFTMEERSKMIISIIVLSDGRIVSGASDGTLRVFDPNTGKCIRTTREESGAIYCVDKLPDDRIVSCSTNNVLRIWDSDLIECKTINLSEFEALNGITQKSEKYIEFLCNNERFFTNLERAGINGEGYVIPINSENISMISDFFVKYKNASVEMSTLDFSWGLSSGEENMLRMFALLKSVFNDTESENRRCIINAEELEDGKETECSTILLFLDEADLTLHPEWQRRLIHLLTVFIPEVYSGSCVQNVQIVLTTHSPLLLGDIPRENICFLKELNTDNPCDGEPEETFGQNIHSILKDSFFLTNGTVGEFAATRINHIAKRLGDIIENEKKKKGIEEYADPCENETRRVSKDGNDEYVSPTQEELGDIRKTIDLVADGILRVRLESLWFEASASLTKEEESERVKELYDQSEKLTAGERLYLLNKLSREVGKE